MINRLHEIEVGLLKNEAEFHQALVRIQGNIKVWRLEVESHIDKMEDKIATQDTTLTRLLEEKRLAPVLQSCGLE